MGNIFNFKRFGMLLLKELKEFPLSYGLSVLSAAGVYVLIMALAMLNGIDHPVGIFFRMTMISLLIVVLMVVVPSKMYGYVNHYKKGIYYTLLPASAFEKMLSMLIICSVVTGLVSFSILVLTDYLVYALFPCRLAGTLFGEAGSVTFFSSEIFSVVMFQACFILGNLYYKKQKIAKTIVFLMFLAVIFGVISFIIITQIGEDVVTAFLQSKMGDIPSDVNYFDFKKMNDLSESLRQLPFVRIMALVDYISWSVIGIGCWTGSYRLIKTNKY